MFTRESLLLGEPVPPSPVMLTRHTVRRGTRTSEWHLTLAVVGMVAGLLVMHGCEVGGRPVLNLPGWSGWAVLGLCVVCAAYSISRGMAKRGQRDEVWGEPSTLDDAVSAAEMAAMRMADQYPLGSGQGGIMGTRAANKE